MLKITNDGLTQTGSGCFIVVPIWHWWASKGWLLLIIIGLKHTITYKRLSFCWGLRINRTFFREKLGFEIKLYWPYPSACQAWLQLFVGFIHVSVSTVNLTYFSAFCCFFSQRLEGVLVSPTRRTSRFVECYTKIWGSISSCCCHMIKVRLVIAGIIQLSEVYK